LNHRQWKEDWSDEAPFGSWLDCVALRVAGMQNEIGKWQRFSAFAFSFVSEFSLFQY
jgi:hypothetical protein